MLDELILRLAWPGAILLVLVLATLSLIALWQHSSRHSRLRRFQDFESRVQPLLASLFSGSVDYPAALQRFCALAAHSRVDFLEKLLMGDGSPPDTHVPILRRLCEDLGLVALWQRRLILRSPSALDADSSRPHFRHSNRRHIFSFVLRAEAAENLGIIRHQPSWQVLVRALSDAHGSVRSVAARSLANIAEPESFAGLAEHLPSAALELAPEISSGTLRMALASFPLSEAWRLKAFLQDPSWQVRSLAAGVITAMLRQQESRLACLARQSVGLDSAVLDIFFEAVGRDEHSEPRARAAEVAGYVDDARALPLLMRLACDPEWFVRLQAVKALARLRPIPAATLSERLTDSHWRVREAAASALCDSGRPGVRVLLDHFAATTDPYSQDQIAEQIGKAGMLPQIIESAGRPDGQIERAFIRCMVRLGKAEVLQAALGNGSASGTHGNLPQDFVEDRTEHDIREANVSKATN